ncbi:unnamed protein product [Mucor hiemalis]
MRFHHNINSLLRNENHVMDRVSHSCRLKLYPPQIKLIIFFFALIFFFLTNYHIIMPILEIISAQTPKDLRSFTKRLNALFAELIGKPESFCLVTFTKVDSFFFAGSDEPGFLVKVGSIGHIDNDRNSKLTAAVTAELVKELGAQDNRGYFIFTDVPGDNIGYKGDTFTNFMRK